MSRATNQLSAPSGHIFITPIKQSDGTIKSVISSKSLSDQSVRVNSTWQGKKWDGEKSTDTATGNWSNSGALFLLMTNYCRGAIFSAIPGKQRTKLLCADVWQYLIGAFILGTDLASTENITQYALAITRPSFFPQILQKQLSEFGVAPFNMVDAAMRGEEDIVLNILNADPSYL